MYIIIKIKNGEKCYFFNLAIYISYYNCLIFMVAIQSHIVLILRLKQQIID
nr:MAG TPA: hypothetical protein [Caudoviricetes sp.]